LSIARASLAAGLAINSGYGTSLRHNFPNARHPFAVPSPRWKVPACRVNAVSSTLLARISAPRPASMALG
jgi:hypothetical protein